MSSEARSLTFALERSDGVSRFTLQVLPDGHARADESRWLAERVLKFLLWQRGAYHVRVAGPDGICRHLATCYRAGGPRDFDVAFFGQVYERPFVLETLAESALPAASEPTTTVGGHFQGCRIGFDAGGSDRKVAALIDGRQVFARETPWQPKLHSDPDYHFRGIDESIREAAAHLPRVDAIGVSSAGIYVANRTRIASLFRRVPEALFAARIKPIYPDIAAKWGNVPLEVRNDGDVTALAGALELGDQPVLGIAMGTSQAAGYVDQSGRLTGWLNELAFAPVDVGPDAPVDLEWSGDRGTGVHYFSQEAVLRLSTVAGIELPAEATPAIKLELVQELVSRGDARARAVFDSIGVYLGYGILLYARFYQLKHVLLLGRVTSGEGGSLLLHACQRVLAHEDPALVGQIQLHLPDEARRRLGQAVTAASLPKL